MMYFDVRMQLKGFHQFVVGEQQILLTHAVWRGSAETGIRFLNEPDINGRPRFEIIQHGWRNIDAAQKFIIDGLTKGWDVWRITKVMEYVKNRRIKNAPFKVI